jgi:leucyl aminopeptidase
MQTLVTAPQGEGIPIWLATDASYAALLQSLTPMQAAWAKAQGFACERHRLQLLPDGEGALAGALLGLGANKEVDELALWDAAPLPERLPAGSYRLATPLSAHAATQFALGWLLGSYRLTRYRGLPAKPAPANLLIAPEGADVRYAQAAAQAMGWARDLINAPANELGPEELAAAALELVAQYSGQAAVHTGEVLAREYPLIAAVGAGSARAPRLVDCRWRRAGAARVTLVGKGVCFDSGGLDIKPSAGMALMKKDMGGAAVALSLAHMLMSAKIRAQLRVLVPAVENAVSGNAYRPGDVLNTRKGLTVEVGNTDAEGRLVLCDALAYADAERPDLIIDFATLTGAARIALGPELPALFGNDEQVVLELARVAAAEHDPLWPMPLWAGYDDELASKIADLSNVASSTHAGAIFGALFLKRFVTVSPWVHIDLYAWNSKERPGRGVGAEAQALRGTYRYLVERYGIA